MLARVHCSRIHHLPGASVHRLNFVADGTSAVELRGGGREIAAAVADLEPGAGLRGLRTKSVHDADAEEDNEDE